VGRKYNRTELNHPKINYMKLLRNIFINTLLVGPFFLAGCEKDGTANLSKEVKVSYPEITLNGSEIAVVALGGTYTDAGAKLKDDISGKITDIQPSSGTVNTSKAGLYVLTFTAANENGFETTAARLVAVTSVTGTPNREGKYLRAATGVNAFITKVADGVYKVKNPGGAGIGVNTVVYFVETAPNTFVCPDQPTDFGQMSVSDINFTAGGATWRVLNASYGTGIRTFTKE
jgi:hypothetical protein